jgi:hypothetical protein
MELFDLIACALRLVYFGVASMMTLFLFLYHTHMRTAGGVSERIWLDAVVSIRTTGKAERCVVVVNTSD